MRNRGITLVEVLLYIALLSILILVALPTLFYMQTWQSKQEALHASIQDFEFIDEKIRNLINVSEGVRVPTPHTTSTVLTLSGQNGADVKIFQDNGILFLQENGSDPSPLHATSSKINSVDFFRTNADSLDRIEFNLEINTFDFSTTTYLIPKR